MQVHTGRRPTCAIILHRESLPWPSALSAPAAADTLSQFRASGVGIRRQLWARLVMSSMRAFSTALPDPNSDCPQKGKASCRKATTAAACERRSLRPVAVSTNSSHGHATLLSSDVSEAFNRGTSPRSGPPTSVFSPVSFARTRPRGLLRTKDRFCRSHPLTSARS